MVASRKPYLIDWRFLPDWLLEHKDIIRYKLNLLGGNKDKASAIGRAWFRFVRPRVARSMISAGVMFIHIPRTGGSSVSRSLYGKNLPHVSIAYYRSLKNRHLASLPSFAIIRDPFDRLASAYRFLLAGGTQMVASSRFDPLGLRHAPSFDAFVEMIVSNPEWRYAYDVLRPQVDFLCDMSGSILVDRLFLFDDFQRETAEFLQWVRGGTLPCINASAATPLTASAATRLSVRMLYNQDYTVFDRICAETVPTANAVTQVSGAPYG